MTTATTAAPPELDVPTIPFDLTVEEPIDGRALAAVAASALFFDLAAQRGPGLATSLLVVALTAALVATGRLRNRVAVVAALAAPVFGLFVAVRLSPPLVLLNTAAALGLLALAASAGRGGDLFDLTVPDLARRAVLTAGHGVAAPGFLLGGDGPLHLSGNRRWVGVVRGALLAAPVMLVLGLLLGAADPVFASLFRVEADVDDVLAHGFLLLVGAWGAGGLVRLASAAPPAPLRAAGRRLGFVEAFVVLGSLVALYAVFVVAQVVAALGGADHVLETAGLTYAEYARSGFFQLLAVATITLAVLLLLRAGADLSTPARRRHFVVMAEVAVALTLVIVAVAVHRLRLYEHAYGLTLPRLFAVAFAVWVGMVFVLLAVSLAGVHDRRRWLVPAALLAGLATVVALDLADPEKMVVHRNVDTWERTGRLDIAHLAALSDDAVPAVVDALPRLDPTTSERLRAALCAAAPSDRDLLGTSLAAARAADARDRICPTG